ncbi:MAG: SIS domain-containing protein [bacterium]|nr:SIS domain-containing protein [bacterium]
MRESIERSIEVKRAILNNEQLLSDLERAIAHISSAFKEGNKILVAGNGGSAADAQHFAAELVADFIKGQKAYPVIALTTDTSILTAWSNDHEFNSVFARQIEALGKKGDIFFAISTSGNSKNLIKAAKQAKQMGFKTIGLLGKGGGQLKDLSDIALIMPSDNTPRIQEAHIMLIHIICEAIVKT